MPLFPNLESDYSFKGRTHTGLVISEGDAPAQEWVVAKEENDNVKFQYAYGPEGNQGVVIAKGKVIEAAGVEYDNERSRKMNAVKQATDNSTKVLGVNHHNLYQRKRDRFSGGNQGNPVVITRSVIELPLFEDGADGTLASQMAAAMKYGAAYDSTLVAGDYLVSDANGNLRKYVDGTDSVLAIVGQALAVEKELPPAGFLQYYMDMNIPELEEFFKQLSHAPSPGKNGDDAGAYPYGYPYVNKGWKGDFEKLLNPTINKGIPFLTDGYFKARQTVTGIAINDIFDATNNNDGHVENVVFSGAVTFGTTSGGDGTVAPAFAASADNAIAGSVQTAAETRNNALFIKLRHEFDMTKDNRVTVKYETPDETNANLLVSKTFSGQDVHIDYTNNMVVLYLEDGVTYHNITLDAELVVDPVAGVPTEWDYAGSVGAVRILLQR